MAENIHFNEKLKFSWGHIIAAVALIAIAYGTFVGAVYLLKGRFALAGIITAAVTLLTGLLFFIPQQLKATERRFDKRIRWERAFVFASPILFILLMVPFAHAWTVHHRQQKILDAFDQVITSATGMFKDYETYSEIRILNYAHTLGVDISDSLGTHTDITAVNKLKVLRLALLSSNYDMLKQNSEEWMSKAMNRKVTTWNVFLLGNITEIQEAIHAWHGDLQTFSQTKLSDEEDARLFDSSNQFLNAIDGNIDSLTALYTDILGFSPMTLLCLLLGYAMLMFPYLLQSRHSKTVGTPYTLFGFRNKKSTAQTKPKQEKTVSNDPDSPAPTDSSPRTAPDEEEKYESFKI